MKLLIVTAHIPFPLDEGGKISQYAFAEKLQDIVDLNYVVVAEDLTQLDYAQSFRAALPRAKVDVINACKATVDHESNKSNVLRLKSAIKRMIHCFVDVFSHKENLIHNKPTEIKDDYDRRFNIFKEINHKTVTEICNLISTVNPDIVQVEHSGFLNLILAIPKKVKVIFVHHEIQYARLESYRSPSTPFEIYKHNLVKNTELLFLSKYNNILTFSEDDKDKLSSELDIPVSSSPFPVLDSFFEEVSRENFRVDKIVLIGPEIHEPNYDAVLWYRQTIAEKIYNETGIKSHVVGDWCSATVERLSTTYLIFDGFVENIKEHNRNSLVVVPLRMGSGIRTKIIYSMAQSLPVVSTAIGCEGIGAIDGSDVIIRNNIEEFMQAIIMLLNDTNKMYVIANSGFNLIKTKFSQEKLVANRMHIYKEMINDKKD